MALNNHLPETILTWWSEEYPCIYCGSTTNTGHIESCKNAGLYDWRGVALPVKPKPAWYELTVVFQANEIIREGALGLSVVSDVAEALVKELDKHGVQVSLISSTNLEQVSTRRVQS